MDILTHAQTLCTRPFLLLRVEANNISYLCYSVDKTIVCICAFVHTRKTFKSTIFGYLLSYTELRAQLFKLSHHTISDAWDTCQ